jgi:hypothetical protein
MQNANQIRGRAIGVLFFASFGTGWLFLSLAAKQLITFATVSSVLVGTLAFFLAAFYLLRLARRWPSVPADPSMRRAFAWINAIQWAAVFVAAFTLGKLHLDAYITSAIAAIIGLHMFPLARLFRYALHYATGLVLVAWAVASAVFVPVEQMQGITALGTGAILWLSAAATLALAFKAARPSSPIPAAVQASPETI